jgi:hypothetical protein
MGLHLIIMYINRPQFFFGVLWNDPQFLMLVRSPAKREKAPFYPHCGLYEYMI